MSQCEGLDDLRTKSECRNQVATDKDTVVEAIGALLITGAKYAYTRSIQAHTKIDPLVGLFAKNRAAATREYARYLLETASNDEVRALDYLMDAQRRDIEALRKLFAEFNAEADVGLNAVRDIQANQFSQRQSLVDQANTLRSIKARIDQLDTEAPLYEQALDIYPAAAEIIVGPRRMQPDVARRLSLIGNQNQQAKSEAASQKSALRTKQIELMRRGLI
jgi:hypothetical protein